MNDDAIHDITIMINNFFTISILQIKDRYKIKFLLTGRWCNFCINGLETLRDFIYPDYLYHLRPSQD